MGAQSEAGRQSETGKVRGVAIGVSRFAAEEARPLPFAATDARAFAAAIRPFGIVNDLADAEATAAGAASVLRAVAAAGADDSVYVFVATHAVRADRDVLIATHDGVTSLVHLLGPVWNGPARRVVLLFDLHRGGVDGGRPTGWELAALFPPRGGRCVLVSDDGAQGSHVSGELQAGIWASHVSAAFGGDAPRAREPDGTLTVRSLRAFLAEEIPRSLARAFTDGRRQSPILLTASDDEVLAEPRAVDRREPAGSSFAAVRFFTDSVVPVKSLGGFRKGVHSPPTDAIASSREWVARLAEPDLAKDLEEATGRMRRHLGYKRRDLRADGPTGGAASVLTPDFVYHVTATQHRDKPDRAVFRRMLAEVRNFDVLGSPVFAEAFPAGFVSLHCAFETPADVGALIDALEDAGPAGLKRLDYPTDLAYCEIELSGFDGRVKIEREGVTLSATGPASPAELSARFVDVKRLLGSSG